MTLPWEDKKPIKANAFWAAQAIHALWMLLDRLIFRRKKDEKDTRKLDGSGHLPSNGVRGNGDELEH